MVVLLLPSWLTCLVVWPRRHYIYLAEADAWTLSLFFRFFRVFFLLIFFSVAFLERLLSLYFSGCLEVLVMASACILIINTVILTKVYYIFLWGNRPSLQYLRFVCIWLGQVILSFRNLMGIYFAPIIRWSKLPIWIGKWILRDTICMTKCNPIWGALPIVLPIIRLYIFDNNFLFVLDFGLIVRRRHRLSWWMIIGRFGVILLVYLVDMCFVWLFLNISVGKIG